MAQRIRLTTGIARDEDMKHQDAALQVIYDHFDSTGSNLSKGGEVGQVFYLLMSLGYRIVPSEEINDLRNLRDSLKNALSYESSENTLVRED